MATTWYHTVDGDIIGETTSGSRTSYLTDAIGSITATQDAAGTTTATWRYKAFGSLIAKTGAGADPRFLWAGQNGSRQAPLPYAEQYNRLRHYASGLGSWSSLDSLWPAQSAYVYVADSPVTYVDPFGQKPTLSYVTEVPAAGIFDCPNGLAAYKWRIRWTVKGAKKPGFIVQEVLACSGKSDCKHSPKLKKDYHLWEAWEVTVNSSGNATVWIGYASSGHSPGRDSVAGIHSPGTCGKSTVRFELTACFFQGVAIGLPDWHVSHAAPTHDLPYTKKKPTFWKVSKDCVSRLLMHEVWCCDEVRCKCKNGQDGDRLTTTRPKKDTPCPSK